MNEKFLSMMGMLEMEKAVEVMVNKAISLGVKFNGVIVLTEDFMGSPEVVTGLVHLGMNGWVKRHIYNSTFTPSDELTKRVTHRFPELG